MLRRVVLALCVVSFGLCLGCGDGGNSNPNPNNLDYSKDGPPKRDGPPGSKKK